LVEDLAGCASGHEVAVIGSAGVVVDEPGVDLGAELAEPVEASSVERGSPALLQGGALSVFDGPRNTWQTAQRVAVSTAVSCQTFPIPLRFPMEKLSRATRSPGRARSDRTRTVLPGPRR
jgi:hypothetical protein